MIGKGEKNCSACKYWNKIDGFCTRYQAKVCYPKNHACDGYEGPGPVNVEDRCETCDGQPNEKDHFCPVKARQLCSACADACEFCGEDCAARKATDGDLEF